ncbi:hypothetical protein L484_025182 [Morus notabilis]|uniref:Uncharacterized protein n=1 Tax=Morus notabilis TaxID=981085 RepID=W9RJ21_9ROSA|nr:hypothetical protein L484_025182 [Morus notabilis]
MEDTDVNPNLPGVDSEGEFVADSEWGTLTLKANVGEQEDFVGLEEVQFLIAAADDERVSPNPLDISEQRVLDFSPLTLLVPPELENISDDIRAGAVLESKEAEASISAKERIGSKNDNRQSSLANRSSTVKIGGKLNGLN